MNFGATPHPPNWVWDSYAAQLRCNVLITPHAKTKRGPTNTTRLSLPTNYNTTTSSKEIKPRPNPNYPKLACGHKLPNFYTNATRLSLSST